MEDPLSRRRVLAAGGAGAALSIAGCNSLRNQDSESSESASGGGPATVTVFADFDQEAMEAYQAELQEQVEAGELDQQEAQMEAQQKQVELMADSVESFEARAEESDDLEVTETVEHSGVLLVEGTGDALIETIGYDEVHGLLAESEFDQYRAADQQGATGADGADEDGADGDQEADGGEEGGADDDGEGADADDGEGADADDGEEDDDGDEETA